MIAQLFDLLLMPVCAMVTGLLVWLLSGAGEEDDQRLFRHFVMIMGVCLLVAWKSSQTDAARMVLEPAFRLQKMLEAQPVYATLQAVAPDSGKLLHDFVVSRMAEGSSLPEAFLLARPLLTGMTNQRMGFASQKPRIAWAQVALDSLRELQSTDAAACYRLIAGQPLDAPVLLHGFSAANSAAFAQGVVTVFAAADRGIRDERAPDDVPVTFNDGAREYHLIMEDIARKYGNPVAKALSTKQFPAEPLVPAEQLCAARITQLDAMLGRPQGMAALLVDSILR